jgi:hypothetical protein
MNRRAFLRLAALAPRAVFVSAPLDDDNFIAASVDRLAASAREVFALLGAREALVIEHPDCDHDFPTATRERAYAVLAQTLLPKI